MRAGSRWPFSSKPENDGQIHYIPFPFFLAYATALLRLKNKQVKLIDSIAEGIDYQETVKKVKLGNPNLIVVEISTPSFENDLKIIQGISVSLPGSQIAVCGPHASVFPKELLTKYDFIDYVLIGEYEYTLLDLVDCLKNNRNLDFVSGLAFRNGKEVVVNNQGQTIKDLDKLPWPEREDVPIYKYNDGFAGLPVPNVQVWTSRGCPFNCIYCLWPQTIYRERKYRKRNPKDVVDEVEYLIKKYGFKAVYFDDDVFNIDKKHVLAICEEIKSRGIRIPWAAMARIDLMDEELLRSMSQSGLYAIKYGVESSDKKILNFCKKDLNFKKVNSTIKLTKKFGIKIHLTFCLGLPGETRQSIEETLKFIQGSHPDSLQFSFASPFPGTEYFRYLQEKGWLISNDWPDYDGNFKCVVRTQELSCAELEEIGAAIRSNPDFNFNN